MNENFLSAFHASSFFLKMNLLDMLTITYKTMRTDLYHLRVGSSVLENADNSGFKKCPDDGWRIKH